MYQLGRRTLSEGQIYLLRGMRYTLERKPEGGDGSNQHSKKELRQIDGEAKTQTAAKLATQYHVSPRTIERDAQYATAVQAIAAATQATPTQVVAQTEGKPGRKEVEKGKKLAEERPAMAAKVIEEVSKIEKPMVTKAFTTKSVEDIITRGDVPPDVAYRPSLQRDP